MTHYERIERVLNDCYDNPSYSPSARLSTELPQMTSLPQLRHIRLDIYTAV